MIEVIDIEIFKAIVGCLGLLAVLIYIIYRIINFFKTSRKTCLWVSEPHAKDVGSPKDASGSFNFLRKIFRFKIVE